MFQSRKSKKVSFEKDLVVLSKVAFYFGIVNFKYDRPRHVLNCTKFNTLLSFLLLGALTLWIGVQSIGMFMTFIATALLFESTFGQKFAIDTMCLFLMYLPSWLYVSKYLLSKHIALPTVVEMLRMFEGIKDTTVVPSLYYERSFQKWLYLKLLCEGILVARKLWVLIVDETSAHRMAQLYEQLVCSTLDMGYVYSQLFLVCIYDKMNEVLKEQQQRMDRATLTKSVRRFSRLSTHVHRFKSLCDSLFMPFFGAAFAGLLFNLIEMNYANLEHVLNLFLVQRLSCMLLNAYAAFNRTISRLVSEQEVLVRDELEIHVELMDRGSLIHRLTTRAYGVMRVNDGFLWKFFLNVTAVKAIFHLRQVTVTQLRKEWL